MPTTHGFRDWILTRTVLQSPLQYIYIIPALVAVTLCAPCLPLGYFWDDYYFLTFKGTGDASTYLLPEHGETFYRPITQGIWFLALRLFGPVGELLAHVLNLAAVVSAVLLLVALVRRLAGVRAGFITGLVFASFGCVPSLVAWASCSQDLLAIVFVLAAFLLRHDGRNRWALVCATAALFCKEPAIAAFPVLAFWDEIVGNTRPRRRSTALTYVAIAFAWVLAHPGMRVLVAHGFQSGATGYVGFDHPERWVPHLARYIMTLLNIPIPEFRETLWPSRLAFGVAALCVLFTGLLILRRNQSEQPPDRPVPLRRIGLLAGLFGLPTLLAPALLLPHWAPYLACMAAVAMAILVGPFLAQRPPTHTVAILALFLLMGVWYRGSYSDREPVWNERVLVEASNAARQVKAAIKKLIPSFPSGSQVLVSVSSTGVRGIQSTLIEGHALQTWYADPTIRTVPTLKRRPTRAPEILVRVTTDLEVLVIDPNSFQIRTLNPTFSDLPEVVRPLVNYARAVAAGGEVDRALRIVSTLSDTKDASFRAYYRRLGAAFLLSVGRRAEAERILAETPRFSKATSLALVKRLLAEPTESEELDEASFEALGLSSSDPATIRWIMNEFRRTDAFPQAAWYANRLQKLDPTDRESLEVLRAAREQGVVPSRLPT